MRYMAILAAFAIILCGCAHAGQNPTVPLEERGLPSPHPADIDRDGNHRLWGQYMLFFDDTHTKVDAVPVRSGRFHLNVLKFLEEYCTNCLQITGIHNNGDGTIDLTVRITHPFPGLPQYTGFDVKGIIMFQGSHEIPDNLYKLPLYPQNFWLSWRMMGDPELLNADGYTYFWSPWYDSGSGMPIFNYRHGKYAKGTPTANVNGFLYFYSNENRHMFECDAAVSRTYQIWLPPGPVTAGYAVEACWEPPLVTPVTDPAVDFPISANQPELYYFKYVINDGKPVTADDPCCYEYSVYEGRAEKEWWYMNNPKQSSVAAWNELIAMQKVGFVPEACDTPPEHPHPYWGCTVPSAGWIPIDVWPSLPDGVYQFFAYEYHAATQPEPPWMDYKVLYPALDVFEIEIDRE